MRITMLNGMVVMRTIQEDEVGGFYDEQGGS